jgi:hypothetical protein
VGFRPVGYFNTGFRMFFGEHVAVRLELRDYVYSAAVQKINGCTSEDLKSLKGGGDVGAGCQADTFVDPKQDANTGYESLKEPSSNITNNFFFAAAFSVLF